MGRISAQYPPLPLQGLSETSEYHTDEIQGWIPEGRIILAVHIIQKWPELAQTFIRSYFARGQEFFSIQIIFSLN